MADTEPVPLDVPGLAEPEYDVQVSLADLQADPNNPLYSVQKFEDLKLSEELLKGLVAMNFYKPSKIQERALPLLMGNPPQNLIGQSQSGTGKTAAFVLNILSRINVQENHPQALILAPSRELARQIQGVILTMGQFMDGLVVTPAIPDPSKRGQRTTGHVIVGTPGTVIDLLRRRSLESRGLRVLVLDEADSMLDQQGLGDQCKRVKSMVPPSIQVVLFSATFPEKVIEFAEAFAPNSNKLTLKHEELTVEGIKQFFFDCDSEQSKYETLVKFYGLLTVNSSIIFCKRRDTAQEIEKRMLSDGHEVAHLSAALEGSDRDTVIDRFRQGGAKVLITTNVLARGIDVSSVTMVVNYDIPELGNGHADPETYLHRIGRTGRFGRVGVAVTFISNKKQWEQLSEITAHFNTEIKNLNKDDWDDVEKTVHEAIKLAKQEQAKAITSRAAAQQAEPSTS
ncbi:ATP-dependent RNA helicase DBP5 [Microthyrium microscopicum]|uniref:RNA helicase n=1 Tax=Microthyrium microscopicum TaxID=703497 RepID=A0A6A6UDI6_9PEZI|nr:ATP-dependent RNA helicase DBP5 [Microthyrium microscopicum]